MCSRQQWVRNHCTPSTTQVGSRWVEARHLSHAKATRVSSRTFTTIRWKTGHTWALPMQDGPLQLADGAQIGRIQPRAIARSSHFPHISLRAWALYSASCLNMRPAPVGCTSCRAAKRQYYKHVLTAVPRWTTPDEVVMRARTRCAVAELR
jgi:hypothetical protein